MGASFCGNWLVWQRLLSFIFLPHVLQCVSLCLIFPTSLVSSFLLSSIEDGLLSLLIFPCFYSFSSSHWLDCLTFLLLPHSALSSFPLSPLNSSPFFSALSLYYLPFFFRYLSSFFCPFFISLCITFKSLCVSLSPPPFLFQALRFPVLLSHSLFMFLPLSPSLSLPARFSALPLFLCLLF